MANPFDLSEQDRHTSPPIGGKVSAAAARITDPNLVNPWGQATLPGSPLWVADNGSNRSTLYSGGVNGSIPQVIPLVVKIPQGAPTGIVWQPDQ